MYVSQHATARLAERLGADHAAKLVSLLERMTGEPGNVAIEVHRIPPHSHGERGSLAQGDQVIVIVRDGSVDTVMLRRSWNQPFTPAALSVARCTTLRVG